MCGGWADLTSKKNPQGSQILELLIGGGGAILINNFDFTVNFLIFTSMFYTMACFKKVHLTQ